MNKKMFEGILNASPEKRYNHFLNIVPDEELVWMVDCGNDSLLSPEIDGIIYYLVWSEKQFVEYYIEKVYPYSKFEIVSIDVHDFCDMLRLNDVMFMIFPTDKDAWVVKSNELYENLTYELSRIEQI